MARLYCLWVLTGAVLCFIHGVRSFVPSSKFEAPRKGVNWPPFLRASVLVVSKSVDKDVRFSRLLLHQEGLTQDSDVVFESLSISELLKEVDRRGLRYSPTTSRQELERMLMKHRRRPLPTHANETDYTTEDSNSVDAQLTIEIPVDKSKPSTTTALSEQAVFAKMTVSELLTELDRRNIRYAPTNTPDELKQLLQDYTDQLLSTKVQCTSTRRAGARRVPDTASRVQSLSISEILKQLDDRDIRYAPTATPEQLRQLLGRSFEIDSAPSRTSSHRSKRRIRRTLTQQSTTSMVLDSIRSSPLSKKASSTVVRAVHRAKLLSRRASDYLFTDEVGIRDVAFEYVSRDDAVAARLEGAKTGQRTKLNKDAADDRIRQHQRQRQVHLDPATSVVSQPSTSNAASQPLLPSSSFRRQAADADSKRAERQSNKHQRSESSNSRRIYSPYGPVDPTKYNKDGLDRLGDFVADSADRIMWGSFDAVNATKDRLPGNQTEPRYWKDRLEERFDYMLGIHQDGGYYKRWTRKVNDEKRSQGGFDAFSVARGKRPKRRGVPGIKSNHDKPIWEQDNLVSLLFGRTPSGKFNLFEQIFSTNGSVLNLFTAIFKSGLIIASFLCRWASCRGALPQPFVVVGASTALICARPIYRFKIVALTFIAMRALGELLHGYVYGSDGWEDDEDRDVDDVKQEDEAVMPP